MLCAQRRRPLAWPPASLGGVEVVYTWTSEVPNLRAQYPKIESRANMGSSILGYFGGPGRPKWEFPKNWGTLKWTQILMVGPYRVSQDLGPTILVNSQIVTNF